MVVQNEARNRIICLISIVLWIHIYTFSYIFQASAEDWCWRKYRLLCLCLPPSDYFFCCLFLLSTVQCRKRVRFSICFHYGSYPEFNWLFYASFCSMSLLDVIYYDFYSGTYKKRSQAGQKYSEQSHIFLAAATTEMMMTRNIFQAKRAQWS